MPGTNVCIYGLCCSRAISGIGNELEISVGYSYLYEHCSAVLLRCWLASLKNMNLHFFNFSVEVSGSEYMVDMVYRVHGVHGVHHCVAARSKFC